MIRTRTPMAIVCAVLAMLATRAGGETLTLTPTERGIEIDGEHGKVTLSYPRLGGTHRQSGVTVRDDEAVVVYEGDAEIRAVVEGGAIHFRPVTLPEGVTDLHTEMILTPRVTHGRTWSFNDAAGRTFPAEQASPPHLYQGQAARFTLRDADGRGLIITTPAGYSYSELTDNRAWNWDVFAWKVKTPVNRDWTSYTYRVSVAEPSGPPGALDAGANADAAGVEEPSRAAPDAPASLRVILGDQRIDLSMGPARTLGLSYPHLQGNDGKSIKAHEIAVAADRSTAALKYPNGASAQITQDQRRLQITFADVPAAASTFRIEMHIPFNFVQSGQYAIGDGERQPFPLEQPASPHLYQGNASSLTLVHPQGGGVRIGLPQHAYQQLQDNRAWNWKIFAWFAQVTIPRDGVQRTFTIAFDPLADAASTSAGPQVDRFGQNVHADFPGKVRSLDELKADVEREQAFYNRFSPPTLDPYGGLPGSGEKLGLKKTGFFHVQHVAASGHPEGRWVLVNPEGNVFFQLGVCAFTRAAYTYFEGRESIYEWLPSPDGEFATAFPPNDYWGRNSVSFHLVNMIRKYGGAMDEDRFVRIMIDRVRRFGFNSEGDFSGLPQPAHAELNFPYVQGVPTAQWHGFPRIPGIRETWDPFDEANVARLEDHVRQRVAPRADDPLLIGYFLVNEPLYQDIPRVVPALRGEWACKRALVRMLRERYGTIAAFNEAWQMDAGSFDELNDRGLPVRTQAAADDMHAYTGLFLETYFRLVRDTMKRHAPNHMLIGNRLQTGTANNQQLCEIAGRYLDVFSLNYYTYDLDRAFLDRLHGWTGGKPMMLTEFYWNSPRDSGLPGGVKDVNSQAERGLAYRHYVEKAAAIPYIVGVQWFTLVDASITGQWFGRYQGENPNSGLFSVADRPWEEMIDHMAATNHRIYDVHLGHEPPFVFDDPRFTAVAGRVQTLTIPRVNEPIAIDGGADGWPGYPATHISAGRLVEGTPGDLEAAFRLAWDPQHLYLLIDVRDSTPRMNHHRGADLWQGDGVELFIGHEKVDQDGPLLFTDRQILLSAGPEPTVHFVNVADQPTTCRLVVTSSPRGDGYTLEAAIPFAALGFTPEPGCTIRFDLAIDDSADGRRRDRQLMWNGTSRNSGDRTAWGRARLISQ